MTLSWDAWLVPARQEGPGQTAAVSLALGLTRDGEQALLGVGLSEREGAQVWLSVFTELQTRGVPASFSACVEGLKGLPEAIAAVLPTPQGPLGMVPKGRTSLRDVPWCERRAVAAALRALSGDAILSDAEHGPGALCRALGRAVPGHPPALAGRWGALDRAVGLSPSAPVGHLSDERSRGVDLFATQSAARPWGLPEGRGDREALRYGAAAWRPHVDPTDAGMESCAQSGRESVRGAGASVKK